MPCRVGSPETYAAMTLPSLGQRQATPPELSSGVTSARGASAGTTGVGAADGGGEVTAAMCLGGGTEDTGAGADAAWVDVDCGADSGLGGAGSGLDGTSVGVA